MKITFKQDRYNDVELILMLWAKTERHYTDDKIKEIMRRAAE